jgi:hypothetical protein
MGMGPRSKNEHQDVNSCFHDFLLIKDNNHFQIFYKNSNIN